MLYNSRINFNPWPKDLAYLSGLLGLPRKFSPPAVPIFTHTQGTTTQHTNEIDKQNETSSDVTWSTPNGSTSDLPFCFWPAVKLCVKLLKAFSGLKLKALPVCVCVWLISHFLGIPPLFSRRSVAINQLNVATI